ncbi:uncharacterized protein LOC135383541 isoform X2 [Ornithodoros turicata]|uniref:uncharacterized protein LOC135383541 isoform X2 n=1 Tax=Ornithodoros turicata TaxID=34597 RepID=UPI003138BA9E
MHEIGVVEETFVSFCWSLLFLSIQLKKCCSRYPSHRLYRRSAELLVLKFPHLRDNFSVNGKMGGHYSWVEALKCKFKNMRKKLDDNPAVLAMREKQGKKRVKPPEEACPNATKRVSRLYRLLEFSLLWKVDLATAFENGFLSLTNIILQHGEASEVVTLSASSTVLGALEVMD